MSETIQNLNNFARLAEQVLANLEKGKAVDIKPSETNIKALQAGLRAGKAAYGAASKGGRKPGSYTDDNLLLDAPENVRAREYMREKRRKEREERERGLIPLE